MNIYLRALINTTTTFLILLILAYFFWNYPLISSGFLIFLIIYIFWLDKYEHYNMVRNDIKNAGHTKK